MPTCGQFVQDDIALRVAERDPAAVQRYLREHTSRLDRDDAILFACSKCSVRLGTDIKLGGNCNDSVGNAVTRMTFGDRTVKRTFLAGPLVGETTTEALSLTK